MAQKRGSELEDLFSQDKVRKRREQEAADAGHANDAKRMHDCAKMLREMVIPPVAEYVDRIREAGHEASLKETIENDLYPSIDLKFRPVVGRSGSTVGLESELTFRCNKSDGLVVWQKIYGPSGSSKTHGSGESPPRAWPQVNREWVEEQLLGFIDAALKEN